MKKQKTKILSTIGELMDRLHILIDEEHLPGNTSIRICEPGPAGASCFTIEAGTNCNGRTTVYITEIE